MSELDSVVGLIGAKQPRSLSFDAASMSNRGWKAVNIACSDPSFRVAVGLRKTLAVDAQRTGWRTLRIIELN